MAAIESVEVNPLPFERFATVLDEAGGRALEELVERARRAFDGRAVWCINSTARGGGVAEMLASLLAYTSGAGVDSRWIVINGDEGFFRVTKRIHNLLHGFEGDGGPLGDAERELYDRALEDKIEPVTRLVSPGDVVLVHDPQPGGLVGPLKELGAKVVWRLHVGADHVNDHMRRAWDFVTPYVEPADAYVFSREQFFWETLARGRSHVIPPSIDVFSPKNQDLGDEAVRSILSCAGIVSNGSTGSPAFERENGTTGMVARTATMIEERRLDADAPLVVQVSRWDRLKDPVGVIRGFAAHVAAEVPDAELVLAGPEAAAVQDDPEGAEALAETEAAFRALPDGVRERVHLALLPMDDRQENAAIVNALQRHATVVVQKSIAEGFGLTVAEGMWKGRPLVASAVGGIADQVVDGETGRLVSDPRDLAEYGRDVAEILADPAAADRMGAAGRQRVLEHFIGVRHLRQWVDLVESL